MAEDQILRQTCWLISNGIPYDVAHAMDFDEAFAHSVIFSEIQSGKKFDWDNMEWPPDE